MIKCSKLSATPVPRYYRYANTNNETINPPFNPQRLNLEHRKSRREPLLFHPNQVARFARDGMGITTL
ncbi:hypothetical protein [Thermosynechococcus sp.]|uniref:hypothetical protein n=1 Tax=Thermosynechococcus sp. TaxID=2814275 RepID=UPI003918819B